MFLLLYIHNAIKSQSNMPILNSIFYNIEKNNNNILNLKIVVYPIKRSAPLIVIKRDFKLNIKRNIYLILDNNRKI